MTPTTAERLRGIAATVALVAFFWFLLTGFWAPDGHHLAGLILLCWLGYWMSQHWRAVAASPLVWLGLASAVYVLVRALAGYAADGGSLEWQIKHGVGLLSASGLLALLLVPWVACPFRPGRIYTASALVVASLLLQAVVHFFLHPDGGTFAALPAKELGLQMGANSLGVICGVILLGCIALGPGLLRRALEAGGGYRMVLVGVAVVSVAILAAAALLLTRSRAAWLAAAATLPLVTIAVLVPLWRQQSARLRAGMLGILALALVAGAGLVQWQWQPIAAKLTQEQDTIAQIARLELDDLGGSSVAARIRMWQAGADAFGERPLFGWSPGASKALIAERTPWDFEHFHSTPVHVAVSLGALGLLLLAASLVVSVREVARGMSSGTVPFELGVFWYGAAALVVIASLFDFQLHDREFQFLAIVLSMMPLALQVDRHERDSRVLPDGGRSDAPETRRPTTAMPGAR